MRFSIIIPVYNVEKYLPRCLESVRRQSFTDFEVIIVDDGSTDSSGEICDRFAEEERRAVVIHKANGGLVSARKAGALIARGEYVLCLDGDDWLHEDYCKTFHLSIENSNADIVVCGFVIAAGENKEKRVNVNCLPGVYDRARLEREIFPFLIEDGKGRYFSPNICAKAVRRDLYVTEQTDVDDKIKIGEDQACSRPFTFLAESMIVLEECLYYYRQNRQSMTKNKSVFSILGAELIYKHFQSKMDFTKFEFCAQADRHFVHDLFNAACSQFRDGKRSKKEIRNELDNYLKTEFVKERLKNCKYSITYIKGRLAKACLKHRWWFLMNLYSKIM